LPHVSYLGDQLCWKARKKLCARVLILDYRRGFLITGTDFYCWSTPVFTKHSCKNVCSHYLGFVFLSCQNVCMACTLVFKPAPCVESKFVCKDLFS
jgi:hypothetical protein